MILAENRDALQYLGVGPHLDAARRLQYDINNIIYAMCGTRGNMYASIKEILRRREGIDIGGVRAPLYDLVEEDMPQIGKCVDMIDAAMEKWVG